MFGFSVVLYEFGLVIPVPRVIVYGVAPVFNLSVYSIPGFTVPACTVKLLVGVTCVDISCIVSVLHDNVLHSKSSYCISHHPRDRWKSLSFLYAAPSPTSGVLSTLILDGFSLVAIIYCIK